MPWLFCYYVLFKCSIAVQLLDKEVVVILVAFFVEEESDVVISDTCCDGLVVAVVNRCYYRVFATISAKSKTRAHEIIRDNVGCERLERDTF